jgi:hypothetical protein
MKTLIASIALAAVIATPALAQTRRAPHAIPHVSQDAAAARAEVHVRPLNSPNAVYEGNQYIGSDPDANVRLMLRMDAEHRDF